ncbi:MAG: hypothetical protein ACLFR1_06905 [Spirochaetia bacterium]
MKKFVTILLLMVFAFTTTIGAQDLGQATESNDALFAGIAAEEMTTEEAAEIEGEGPLGAIGGGLIGGYVGYRDARKRNAGPVGTAASVAANAFLGAVAVGFVSPF